MAYITWVIRILLFLVLLGFAARNLDPVHVRGFLGLEWRAPLVVVMLVVLVTGVVLGVLGALRMAVALRRPLPQDPPPMLQAASGRPPTAPLPAEGLPGDGGG